MGGRNPLGTKSEGTEETLGRRNVADLSSSVSKLLPACRVLTCSISLDAEHLLQKISVLGNSCTCNIPL